ncbi:hypothetical protein BpHYR1_040234 [Brachionus plicatilis]|uniref:Uncharacterized protein n=1 Tax=Brachionus plicatilis TaxID=10195 RepID=A0A3M7PBD6_BRAPC|nr:hypothetical protein BpHYR1_040234 [Brachionus plicatilis]
MVYGNACSHNILKNSEIGSTINYATLKGPGNYFSRRRPDHMRCFKIKKDKMIISQLSKNFLCNKENEKMKKNSSKLSSYQN